MYKQLVTKISYNHLLDTINDLYADDFILFEQEVQQQRNVIICVCPHKKYRIPANQTTLFVDGIPVATNRDAILKTLENKKMDLGNTTDFYGGFVGYLAYEFYHALENKLGIGESTDRLSFNFYEACYMYNPVNGELFVQGINQLLCEELIDRILLSKTVEKEHFTPKDGKEIMDEGDYKSSLSQQDFMTCVDAVIEEINAGNVYQINLTRKLSRSSSFYNNAFDVNYAKWIQQYNFSKFFTFFRSKKLTFISSSPERFIKVEGDVIKTYPIKGTRPRKNDSVKDVKMLEELRNSTKDHQELLMITDLMRNDLNKVCIPGSVKVEQRASIIKTPTVYHLQSEIKGKLKTKSVWEVLFEMFPGGSITGAPKKAAMELINKLERSKRGIYTGIFGYINLNNCADFSIIIRTLQRSDDDLHTNVGGGIVYDSVPEFEYLETKQKAMAILKGVKEVQDDI